jgi:hypothetical protein
MICVCDGVDHVVVGALVRHKVHGRRRERDRYIEIVSTLSTKRNACRPTKSCLLVPAVCHRPLPRNILRERRIEYSTRKSHVPDRDEEKRPQPRLWFTIGNGENASNRHGVYENHIYDQWPTKLTRLIIFRYHSATIPNLREQTAEAGRRRQSRRRRDRRGTRGLSGRSHFLMVGGGRWSGSGAAHFSLSGRSPRRDDDRQIGWWS